MNEIWKPIPGYEGYYEASNLGSIRSIDRTIVLKDRIGNQRPCIYKGRVLRPYLKHDKNEMPRKQVVLSKNGTTRTKDVHKLVAMTFIPNLYGAETVNHKDGDTLNNEVSNLEWASLKENIQHAFKNGLIRTAKPVAAIEPDTMEIVKVYAGEAEACRRIGVGQGKVRRAIKTGWKCKGFYWRYFDTEKERSTTIEPWEGFPTK